MNYLNSNIFLICNNLNSNISGSSCRVYALDYGIEQEADFDILVPAEDKHNNYPSLAYRIFFQVAHLLNKIDLNLISI